MKDPRPDSETTEMIETKKVKIGKVPEPPPPPPNRVVSLPPAPAETPKAGEVWYVRFPGELRLSECKINKVTERIVMLHRLGVTGTMEAYELGSLTFIERWS